jgi:hypothetical protein
MELVPFYQILNIMTSYTNVSDWGFEVSELRTMNGCEVRVSL